MEVLGKADGAAGEGRRRTRRNASDHVEIALSVTSPRQV